MSKLHEQPTAEGFFGDAIEGEEDFAYRAISRAAILSAIFGVFGFLAWVGPLLTILPLIATIFAIIAFMNIRKYPSELTGKAWATIGLLLGLTMLVAAPAKHTYIYFTEVPDGYERISFSALKSKTGAPDFPTVDAVKLDGQKIFLKGYIHPTSLASMSAKSFVLVPDWATCCFGSQPPLTHMVEVRLMNDKFASKSFRQHSIAGTFHVTPQLKQVDGLTGVYYTIEADHFE